MLNTLPKRFNEALPAVDFCSLRYVETRMEHLSVRQDVVEPPNTQFDAGAMVTVVHQNGLGYAATSDLSAAGLRQAIQRASEWAERARDYRIADFSAFYASLPVARGEYRTPVSRPWDDVPLAEKLDLLVQANHHAKVSDRIVDYHADLWHTHTLTGYWTNRGDELLQERQSVFPTFSVVAHHDGDSQRRSFADSGWQGGFDALDQILAERPGPLAEQALQLLAAPNCPEQRCDVLLMPDQMMLQIHESIGHPLELDRILGDERNYAGRSFVTPELFGTYQYGSPLLNVTFDPSDPREFASYGFDDEGERAEKQYVIRDGVLQRPLGGGLSRFRAGLEGVANARASHWNRPPIDRMANLNVEAAGEQTVDDLVAGIERGILLRANNSWSIDDSRNKFQFGCEWGQLIEQGQLTQVVKNPNYRGISAEFWRNLRAVGGTAERHGIPFCGKGEPNQLIPVGHTSPPCVFADVDVFGGA